MRDKDEMCKEKPKAGGNCPSLSERRTILSDCCCWFFLQSILTVGRWPLMAPKFTHHRWNHRECLLLIVMTTESQQRTQPVWLDQESTPAPVSHGQDLQIIPDCQWTIQEEGSTPRKGDELACELDRNPKKHSPVRQKCTETNTSVSQQQYQGQHSTLTQRQC